MEGCGRWRCHEGVEGAEAAPPTIVHFHLTPSSPNTLHPAHLSPFTPHTLHPAPCTPHTSHLTPCTTHTLHLNPCTVCSVQFTPNTSHLTPHTLHTSHPPHATRSFLKQPFFVLNQKEERYDNIKSKNKNLIYILAL